ncbi:hypothetical protein [Ruminococcus sp.]|uniref:hypothetical protein n=1 Tax=Ruminococcus sp. TaxID=41978 RepID=UPI002CCAD39E|nr:hypothetical protein [Ruminococcus sp.]HOA00219.1 hypothetical protein [Ruminococcus sp.]HOH87660.1 hypothetical protein [Ruminococcus sp.]
MKKHRFTAVTAALALLPALCGCTDGKSSSSDSSPVSSDSQVSSETASAAKNGAAYSDGTYSGEGFSLYADPAIWEYTGDQDDAPCDLQLRSGGGANTCGVSVYVSDDDHGGKSAQDIVMNDNDERIIYTGALATTALTFYYYEWTIDEEKHGRTYFADYDGKYLCVYAESPNFGYVESKIADLLGGMTLSENSK